ncbi:MAG: hypothetical protein M3O09_12530 [Acidobacteriota bacterium]|nr:hypothetical protein [Acidobacteriota bacterium]
MTVSADIAGFVAGIVAQNATQHTNNLDQWVKAPGLLPGDARTIQTVTYMQATSFTYLAGIKNKSDEWYPDVKCAISLSNPEPREVCTAKNEPTPSSGLLKMSASCSFNQNKNNTLPGVLGQVIVGALQAGIVGVFQNIVILSANGPSIAPIASGSDLPTGGALEVAYINTCPLDVQALNNGTELLITRNNPVEYYSAKLLADQWNQQSSLAAHLRGEVPKTIETAKNDSYWQLAQRYYSSGKYWLGIAQANNWRALVPGMTIQLPPMQELLFGSCYIHQKESLWMAGLRLKRHVKNLEVAKTVWLTRPKARDSVYPLERLALRSGYNCEKQNP